MDRSLQKLRIRPAFSDDKKREWTCRLLRHSRDRDWALEIPVDEVDGCSGCVGKLFSIRNIEVKCCWPACRRDRA